MSEKRENTAGVYVYSTEAAVKERERERERCLFRASAAVLLLRLDAQGDPRYGIDRVCVYTWRYTCCS